MARVVPDPITGMQYEVEPPRHWWNRWRVEDDWCRDFYGRTLDAAMKRARAADPLLDWESADTDEPGDQNAQAREGYYAIGPDCIGTGRTGEWSIELRRYHDDGREDVRLPNQPDESAAKKAAQEFERNQK